MELTGRIFSILSRSLVSTQECCKISTATVRMSTVQTKVDTLTYTELLVSYFRNFLKVSRLPLYKRVYRQLVFARCLLTIFDSLLAQPLNFSQFAPWRDSALHQLPLWKAFHKCPPFVSDLTTQPLRHGFPTRGLKAPYPKDGNKSFLSVASYYSEPENKRRKNVRPVRCCILQSRKYPTEIRRTLVRKSASFVRPRYFSQWNSSELHLKTRLMIVTLHLHEKMGKKTPVELYVMF